MGYRTLKHAGLVLATLILASQTASAHYLIPVQARCNYRSLMDDDCVVCETVNNFTRDYPMGKGFAPSISSIKVEREKPFPGETFAIRIKATSDGSAGDQLPVSMQRIMGVEVAYTTSSGRSWYTNNYDGSNPGSGIPADYFTREVLVVKNQGTIRYQQYQSSLKPWAVTPESASYVDGDLPAPNRRCPADPILCNAAEYSHPWNDDCPYGITCPLYDTFYPNKGDDGGFANWPTPDCNQADGDCNVPGFPEGGGDLLDAFPTLDPTPGTDYLNIPGNPLVRVNGVPAIDCDVYNGVNRVSHELCNTPPDPDIKAVYDQFGIKAYKLSPGQGMVRFTEALSPIDVVDATFYSGDMSMWTAKIDMTEEPFDSEMNFLDGRLSFHVKVFDTCGNLASGGQSPPYPPFPGESNEAYVGVYDFYYDQRPTDTDPMGAIGDDNPATQCSATDTLCPEDPLWVPATSAQAKLDYYALHPCNDEGCECCYNECKGDNNTWCDYNGPLMPNVGGQCHSIADDGNPPGCGPEYGNKRGMAELREFKMSHSASNLYVKMKTQGDVLWGCYGSWYPLVGCEYSFGDLGSKFNGYAAQMINTAAQGTFYLIVVPDIPIYGSLPLYVDVNKLLEEAMGNAYDGMELERYAAGGGCKKPGEDEEPPGDPCEDLGCDPDANPSGDCDGDGFVNGTDACPCEDGGDDSEDGCKPEDPDSGDPLAEYKCSACQIGTEGSSLYVEMGIEDTLGDPEGGSYHAMAMTMAIHNLDMDWLLYYACLNGYNLTALAQDQTPRISYYPFGNKGRSTVELQQDYIPPMNMNEEKLRACLGRCDEADKTDGADGDSDLVELEPVASNRVDEGYDPMSTQIEFQFQEVVFNNDYYKSDLIDLGGYEIQIARDMNGPFETYYVMCDPDASADCYGMNSVCKKNFTCTPATIADDCPDNGDGQWCSADGYCCYGGDRDTPAYDEPYDGVTPVGNTEVRTRFPNPFEPTAAQTGYGFPGEPISCIIDNDCDPTDDNLDNDKDGLTDEACWSSNCYDDEVSLTPDGQSYWLRVRAFDIPKETATDTFLTNYTDWTKPVGATILRNTVPPDIPDVVASYAMASGGTAKVVWNENKEHDIGGYVVYRCPANPIVSVQITLNEGEAALEEFCSHEENYRMAHKEILDNLNGYYVDDGMGYYETGIGTGATDSIDLGAYTTWGGSPCTYQNDNGDYIVDDKCNWTENNDIGVDGATGGVTFGEGDHLPTPGIPGVYDGEPNAYEWIDCSSLTGSGPGGINPDLEYCGNIEDPDSGWWTADAQLFNDNKLEDNATNVAIHLYDVPDGNPPVLFYNGLVDGYKYFYRVKAVDSPYLGDGHNPISTSDNCDDGITPYTPLPAPNGCVNPIEDRTCDDKRIAYDWTSGGNCSDTSPTYEFTPVDIQPAQKPIALSAAVQKTGEDVSLSWETPVTDRTFDHYNVYRSVGNDKKFACVRGGCRTTTKLGLCGVYWNDEATCKANNCNWFASASTQLQRCRPAKADGCPCTTDEECYQADHDDPDNKWNRVCAKPLKICTNAPYYTIDPQTSGCTEAPFNAGCQCTTDADCGVCSSLETMTACENAGCNWDADESSCSGNITCDYGITVCTLDPDDLPADYEGLTDDRMDNDGDGVIDEDFAGNGIDDDGDGLIDEDTGTYSSEEELVGGCPVPEYPYWQMSNWASRERITTTSFLDKGVMRDQVYYYRVSGVDNAVYDSYDDDPNDEDPPPPNEGLWSFSTIAKTSDTEAPAIVSGHCNHPVTHNPMPCVERMTASTYETRCGEEDVSIYNNDFFGNQLTIRWRRSSEQDILGYYVYRADDITGSGIEPPTGAFEKVAQEMTAQPPPGEATDAICFKDTDIDNNLDYYYAVTAVDERGNESYLSEINGPVQAIDDTAPMNPPDDQIGTASDVNGNRITVTWSDHSEYANQKLALQAGSETDFDHFRVYRSDNDPDPPEYPICDSNDLCDNNGSCSSDTDCTTGSSCQAGLCCSCNVTSCTMDSQCESRKCSDDGFCVVCTKGRDCESGICSASGLCECSGDSQCSDGEYCIQGKCCSNTSCCGGEYQDPDPRFVDYNVIEGKKYYYCVTAVDDEGNESDIDFATGVLAIPMDTNPPTPPASVSATPMAGEKIGLGWEVSDSYDVACYQPRRSTTGTTGSFTDVPLNASATGYMTVQITGQSQTLSCISELSYYDDDPDLSAGTTYYYAVRAVDQNGNQSADSTYVSVKPTITDTTAPELPSIYYLRSGYSMGEVGSEGSDGQDNNGDGFVDEGYLSKGQVGLYWQRPQEADVKEFEIYRKSPAMITGCTCDVDSDPLGDCDQDSIKNALDDCPCTPDSPSTAQAGTYTLIDTESYSSVCPSQTSYPTGKNRLNYCYYKDTNQINDNTPLCPGSRYWYLVVPIDEELNSAGVVAAKSFAVNITQSDDTDAPETPSKPKLASAKNGTALVVKFEENDYTVEDNMDVAGYIIYRDTLPTGSFTTKVAILNDISSLNYCAEAEKAPCYCDEADPDYACLLDIGIQQSKRYYYKISAFDYSGNESGKSDWNFGMASPTAPGAVSSFTAKPKKSDPHQLLLTWDAGSLLDDPNIQGFRLFRSAAEEGVQQVIDPDTDTTSTIEYLRTNSFTDSNLVTGSTYWYMIYAVSDDGSEGSSVKTCGVPGEDIFPPSPPTGLSAAAGDKQVKLTWQANVEPDHKGYNIYRAQVKEYDKFKKINTATITQPIYTDTGLTNSSIYYYAVTAYDESTSYDTEDCYPDESGESGFSKIVTAIPISSGGNTTALSIGVLRGWNLIFIPPGDTRLGGRIATLGSGGDGGETTAIPSLFTMAEDKDSNQLYKVFTPDLSNFGEIFGRGYWYYSDSDDEALSVAGAYLDASPYDMPLDQGWNLVGNPFADAYIYWDDDYVQVSTRGDFMSISEAIDKGIVTHAFRWDPEAGEYHEVAAGEGFGDRVGFFVKVSQPCTMRFMKNN